MNLFCTKCRGYFPIADLEERIVNDEIVFLCSKCRKVE